MHLNRAHRIRSIILLLTATTTLAAGCISSGGGGGSSNGDGDPPDDTQLASERTGQKVDTPIDGAAAGLDDVGLARESAEPFDHVAVTGLPDDIDVTSIHVEYEDESTQGAIGPDYESPLAVLYRPAGDEDVYLVVPPVLDDSQTLRIKVTDGERYSGAMALDVEPLAEAEPEVFDDLVADLESLTKAVTEGYGLTYPGDLQDDLDNPGTVSTDEALVDLLRVYDTVANPENPDSLRNRDLSEDERALIGGYVAQTGLDETVANTEAFINDDETRNAMAELEDRFNLNPHYPASASITPLSGEGIALTPPYDIDGPAELEAKMKLYEDLRSNFDEFNEFEDFASDTVDALALHAAAASGGTLAAPAAKVKAFTEGVLSGASAVVSLADYGLVFLPCCIDDIDVVSTPEPDEDRNILLANEDTLESQFQIIAVNVDARSNPQFGGDMMEALFDFVSDEISGAADLDDDLAEFGSSALFEQLEDYSPDVYFSWEGIDVTNNRQSEEYVDIEITAFAGGGTLAEGLLDVVWDDPLPDQWNHTLDPDSFFGSELDQNILRVKLDADRFPDGAASTVDGGTRQEGYVLRGAKIRTNFNRDIYYVEEGEPIEIQFRVRNSREPDYKDLELDGPGLIDNDSMDADGVGTVTYVPPETLPDDFDATLEVAADSTDGVRGYGNATERDARTRILKEPDEAFINLPGRACLEPGETRTLEAQVYPEDAELAWEAPERGNINQDDVDPRVAVFTATENLGQATVTVETLDDDLDLQDSDQTVIDVAENCACYSVVDDGGSNSITVEVTDNADPLTGGSDVLLLDGQMPQIAMQISPDTGSGFDTDETASLAISDDGEVGATSGTYSGVMTYTKHSGTSTELVASEQPQDVQVLRESLYRARFQYSASAIRTVLDSAVAAEPTVTAATLGADIRPRFVNLPSDATEEQFEKFTEQVIARDESTWQNVVNRGNHFEHTASGIRWTNCD